jgi:UDP-N-acetylmuramoyl-tripeptide--D-alanyl-D-alanine ligase
MTQPLWTSDAIVAATGGTASAPFAVTGISIDTRTLVPGELFVALKDVRDGHDFATAAFAAGAAGALVSRPVEGGPFVEVPDVMAALTTLGLAARQRASEARRVAVTGSVGKTSVKEMLARILTARGPAHASAKSFNNHWGVPLTLARMPARTLHAAFEIGMSTPGEIAPRSLMVAPHVAVITKIAPAHLEGLGSITGIAREKSDIAAGLLPGGVVVLPLSDTQLETLITHVRGLHPGCAIALFGRAGDFSRIAELEARHGAFAALALVDHVETDGVTTTAYIAVGSRGVRVTLNAVGEHWADNAACALLAATLARVTGVEDDAAALDGYAPPPGRGTAETLILPGDRQITLVDEAYNANPASMRAALAGFAARPCRGRRILALGEMLEVGATSAAEHASLAGPVLATGARMILLAGPGMGALSGALQERAARGTIQVVHAVKAENLKEVLKNALGDGDLLLLKGSNASGMGKLAEAIRHIARRSGDVVNDTARTAVGGDHAV